MTIPLHWKQAVCLAVRLLFALAAFGFSNGVIVGANAVAMKVLAALALVAAVGMGAIWALGLRKTARESLHPSKRVWWMPLRPVHSVLYAAFALMVFFSSAPHHAYSALLADTGVGLGAFVTKNALG